MSKSFAHILSLIQENNVEMVNLKITDAEGQFHQVTIPSEGFSMDLLKDGINIDTSTYAFVESGKGDAIFIPDPDTAAVDADSMISTVVIAGQLRFFGSNAEPDTKPSKFARIISQTLSLFALLSGLTVFFYVLPRWLIVCCCGGMALATLNIEGMSLSIALAGMLVLLVGEIIAFIIGLVGLILAMIGKKIRKKIGRPAKMARFAMTLIFLSVAMWIIPVAIAVIAAIIWLIFILIAAAAAAIL